MMNSTLAVDRNDTLVDSIGRQPLLYVQQTIHYLGLDRPVHMRIVNKIIPVPDQQLMISIPNSKNTDQTVHLQRLIKTFAYFFLMARLN